MYSWKFSISSPLNLVVEAYVWIMLREYFWFFLRIRNMIHVLVFLAGTIFLAYKLGFQHLSGRFLLLRTIKHFPPLELLDLVLLCGLIITMFHFMFLSSSYSSKSFSSVDRILVLYVTIYSGLYLWWCSLFVLVWLPQKPRVRPFSRSGMQHFLFYSPGDDYPFWF